MFPRTIAAALVMTLLPAGAALAAPRTTVELTIRDRDGDNLLEFAPGEDYVVIDRSGSADSNFKPPRRGSILNFLHLTDFQLIDEESPARVEFLDTTQQSPLRPFSAAYRPQESLTTQVTESMVRQVRNTTSPVTSKQVEMAVLTGDNADSQQHNETRWFIDILDGNTHVDPNSGIPVPGCEGTPGSVYDGVKGGGDLGYWDPDSSEGEDGKGYSPRRQENQAKVQSDVTVRDFPGLFEAANQPFRAIGLDVPWYSAFGNHDALIQGNSPDAYFGPIGPGHAGPDATETSNPVMQGVATGCLKPVLPPPTDDPVDRFHQLLSGGYMVVPPDPRRCFLAKDEPDPSAPAPCNEAGWIGQHFLTTGQPAGHGFAPGPDTGYGRPPVADLNDDGYYSFSPKPGLRFLVLDTVTDECGAIVCAEGSIDDPQYRWIQRQLAAALAQGEYVMAFSHHTLKTTRFPSTDATEFPIHYGQRVDRDDNGQPQPEPQNVSLETLEDLWCGHPNFIAHVTGHEHENFVEHHACDGSPAVGFQNANDFYEISTAAHLDWPQQSRMVELVDNGDSKTMSLVLTMLDHAGPPNPGNSKLDRGNGSSGEQVLKLASIAREIGYNDYQNSRGATGDRDDRNVIIVIPKPWPYAPAD